MHYARWMSNAIYALMAWIFQRQFKFTAMEEKGLRQIAVFVSRPVRESLDTGFGSHW